MLRPKDPQVRLALLVAQQDAGRWDDAYEIARRWSVDEPRNGKPWYYMGRLAAQSGKFLEQGEAALRTYLTLPRQSGDPEPKHARYRLGQVLAHAGRKDEARAELQGALKIDPRFAEAKDALAEL